MKCKQHQQHPASAVSRVFPKFRAENLILFSSSPPLCFHFIHIPKSAFHPMSFLTTLVKIEAISLSPTHLTNPGPCLFLLHTNQTQQAEVSLGTHTGFLKRNWRQEMLLHTGTNCSPMAAHREALGAVVKAESPDTRSCCCITARASPLFGNVFKSSRHLKGKKAASSLQPWRSQHQTPALKESGRGREPQPPVVGEDNHPH